MPRPATLPERIQFQAPEGTIAAVEGQLQIGEALPDLWRRLVSEWLASREPIPPGERM